jgi:hypothetical protein
MPKTRKSNKRNRKTRRGGNCKLNTNTMFGGNKRMNNNLELMGGSNKLNVDSFIGGSNKLNVDSFIGGANKLVGSELVDCSNKLIGGNKHLNGSIYGGSKKRRKRVKRGGSSVGNLFGASGPITETFNKIFGTRV